MNLSNHVSGVKLVEKHIFSRCFLVPRISYIKRERTNFIMFFELSLEDVFHHLQKIGTCYQVVQRLKRLLPTWETGFDPWVRKIPWSRKRQPTPVFMPGKSHGPRSLVGHNPWGCKESDTTERLLSDFCDFEAQRDMGHWKKYKRSTFFKEVTD